MRDVIVVGAGAGGPVVAKELAARGLDVLLLEGGGDHADPGSTWNHFEHDANDPIRGYMRFGPRDRRLAPWPRDIRQNLAIVQSAGLGGTTQHYFGNSPRAMPGAFAGHRGRGRERYDSAHLFPFSYRSLVPYYEWVEATLPVRTALAGRKERVFLRAAERTGLPLQRSKDVTRPSYRPQENAILQPRGTAARSDRPEDARYPSARGCTHCGHCFQGCTHPHGAPLNLVAKRSTDVSYLPMALTADRWAPGGRAATVLTDAFATRVGTAQENGETVARSVTWRVASTGEQLTEEARVVVLAAGPIETPRLWINSELPDPNGWVGRGLTEHYLDWVFGTMPYETGADRGPSSAARIDVPGRGCIEQGLVQPALMASINALSDHGMWGHYDNGAPTGLDGTDAVGRRVGNDLRRVMEQMDRLLAVFVLTDDDVEAQNRVTVSPSLSDAHGPVARIEVHHRARSRRTLANRAALVRRAAEMIRGAGATHVWRVDLPPLLIHIHSTMRMGASESDSVLDANAESRAVRRLFVADNSALANALGGPNPTLTTQALATRTAERIFVRCFDGDPWVRGEAPLPSTARAITRALGGMRQPAAG